MSQVPGTTSPENSSTLHNKSPWITPRRRKVRGKKEDGRASGETSATSSATSFTEQKTLEDKLKEDAHRNAILKRLQDDNYMVDFHGDTWPVAHKRLEDIIISLTHNMKGTKQQFIAITGKGNHSINGIPKIKASVLGYLKANGIEHKLQEKNSGRIDIIVYKK